MAILREKNRFPDIVRRELDEEFSRDEVTFASGAAIPMCAVLGRVDKGPPVAEAVQGNAGNGLVTDLAAGDLARIGVYTLVCVAASANAATFRVIDPTGARLDDAVTGLPFESPHLAFTLTDGETDFAPGDAFTITVPPGSGKYKLLAPDATDGTQVARGLSIAAYDAATADVRGVIIARDAVVLGDLLSWPAGISDSRKALALAQLAEVGIKNGKGV